MAIRTTVTLEDDVMARVKHESKARGASFRDTLNDLVRAGLVSQENRPFRRTLKINPVSMGHRPELNNDSIEALIEYGEGPEHR